jgi:hypothetical protein
MSPLLSPICRIGSPSGPSINYMNPRRNLALTDRLLLEAFVGPEKASELMRRKPVGLLLARTFPEDTHLVGNIYGDWRVVEVYVGWMWLERVSAPPAAPAT